MILSIAIGQFERERRRCHWYKSSFLHSRLCCLTDSLLLSIGRLFIKFTHAFRCYVCKTRCRSHDSAFGRRHNHIALVQFRLVWKVLEITTLISHKILPFAWKQDLLLLLDCANWDSLATPLLLCICSGISISSIWGMHISIPLAGTVKSLPSIFTIWMAR